MTSSAEVMGEALELTDALLYEAEQTMAIRQRLIDLPAAHPSTPLRSARDAKARIILLL